MYPVTTLKQRMLMMSNADPNCPECQDHKGLDFCPSCQYCYWGDRHDDFASNPDNAHFTGVDEYWARFLISGLESAVQSADSY